MGRRRLAARRLRRRHNGLVRESFSHLGDDVLEAFFGNFGYAMALSLLSRLDTICRVIGPRTVVELGAGVSTAVIAKALPAEGLLISIERDLEWLERTQRLTAAPSRVAYLCVPSPGLLERIVPDSWRADLLVVDGPAGEDRFSDDLAAVYGRLATSGSVVVVDDTDREENDRGATLLAAAQGLRKIDYSDPMYTGHRYAILVPDNFDPELLT